MQKVPLDISEIRVAKSSMQGYDLNIFLKSEVQLKLRFHEHKKYRAAKSAKKNLSILKYIFRENIDKILKENPQYFYLQSNCELFEELFGHILEDPDEDQYYEAMDLLRSCAIEKNIEFDGYFLERWKESADTIFNFDEEYFKDPYRCELYVYLSAMVDSEIFGFLEDVLIEVRDITLTRELAQKHIDYLTIEKGVSF